MVETILIVGFFLVLLWLIFLTVLFWQVNTHYNRLVKTSDGKTLRDILVNLLTSVEMDKKSLARLSEKYDKIEKEGAFHIQKIGLLRFNPFKDTGGNQSFILTLVDAANTGVVISGLYSRSGTRWYAKKVKNGKGIDHELSEEELKALKNAESFV